MGVSANIIVVADTVAVASDIVNAETAVVFDVAVTDVAVIDIVDFDIFGVLFLFFLVLLLLICCY